MLILDLWGISFHAVVVFGLGKNLLLKFVLGHCAYVKRLSNKLIFLSFHDNISLPCISEAATGLIRLHVTVHQKDRNQDQCGRPRRQKAQSLHPFNAL